MARSPLTLAAAATAAVPGIEIVGATALTCSDAGHNESAVATLADGRRIVVRAPQDESTDADLATEALALRALTDGVRSLLDIQVPEFLGAAPIRGGRIFVTTFIPGYLVAAEHIPAGRGVAESLGHTLAAVHGLPPAVVRSAGLPSRSAAEVRTDARRIMDEASAMGKVPVRLMVRWREVLDDDAVWQFEPTVTLGGIDSGAFIYQDRAGVPAVNGIIDWHGLQVHDPAIDMQFLHTAAEGAESIHAAYVAASNRATDDMLLVRSRLHSELEFAKWLLHGRDSHRDDIIEDAASMLDSLAEDVRDVDLRPQASRSDVAGAMAALQSTPSGVAAGADTSMQTDTYGAEDLMFVEQPSPVVSDTSADTQRIDPIDATGFDRSATQPIAPEDIAGIAASDRAAHEHLDTSVPRIDPDFIAGLGGADPDPDATAPIDPGFFAEDDRTQRGD